MACVIEEYECLDLFTILLNVIPYIFDQFFEAFSRYVSYHLDFCRVHSLLD